jgi:hypothetical protein
VRRARLSLRLERRHVRPARELPVELRPPRQHRLALLSQQLQQP